MRIRALAVIAVFAFGCVHVDTVACAADRYVSTTGSPLTGDGSKANPWATIAQADLSGKLQPGDVVHVAPGTYTAHVRTYTSGKSGEPITYVSDTLWGAVLPGGWSNHANYIKIVDFEVAGSTGECGIYT